MTPAHFIFLFVCVYVCIHFSCTLLKYIYVCIYVYICIYLSIYLSVYIYIYIYIYWQKGLQSQIAVVMQGTAPMLGRVECRRQGSFCATASVIVFKSRHLRLVLVFQPSPASYTRVKSSPESVFVTVSTLPSARDMGPFRQEISTDIQIAIQYHFDHRIYT